MKIDSTKPSFNKDSTFSSLKYKPEVSILDVLPSNKSEYYEHNLYDSSMLNPVDENTLDRIHHSFAYIVIRAKVINFINGATIKKENARNTLQMDNDPVLQWFHN